MIKSKPCRIEGCGRPSFSKGLCKAHTPKKPIRKRSQEREKRAEEKKKLIEEDIKFYLAVYDKMKIYNIWKCIECHRHLGEPLMTHFHHLLPKQTYPQFRHHESNIAVLCPDCHNQVETNIDRCPATKELTRQARIRLLGESSPIPDTPSELPTTPTLF